MQQASKVVCVHALPVVFHGVRSTLVRRAPHGFSGAPLPWQSSRDSSWANKDASMCGAIFPQKRLFFFFEVLGLSPHNGPVDNPTIKRGGFGA